MATCIATMKNAANSSTLGRPFVLPAATQRKLTIASGKIGNLPAQREAISQQDPDDEVHGREDEARILYR